MRVSMCAPVCARASVRSCLCFGQAERRGQFHSLRGGQVPLDLKSLLQTGELRVGENRPSFAAPAVLPRQLRMVLEQGRHLHPCRRQKRKFRTRKMFFPHFKTAVVCFNARNKYHITHLPLVFSRIPANLK